MYRPAVATLSKQNLIDNVENIQKKVFPAKIIAMVKANGYGHGLREIGSILDGKVAFFGVCSLDEALLLHSFGIKTPIILTQGVFSSEELHIAASCQFDVVFHNHAQLSWLESITVPFPVRSWIKINTGLGRLGFQEDEFMAIYNLLRTHQKTAKPIRILSHFACADIQEHPLNSKQINRFSKILQQTSSEYSLCNSAGILHFPKHYYHYVRPGILLYGVSPIANREGSEFNVQPVMTMRSKLIAIQTITANETIGYGATYTLPQTTRIGVVAFGYGDGYPQTADSTTPILVKDTLCHLIGRVSMDLLTVNLNLCPSAAVGDSVTLWGEGLPIEQVCSHSSQSVWNTLTGIQSRVHTEWI